MAKPVVDRIEDQLAGKTKVIRLNLLSQVGRQAASRYGVRGVPMLVVVNGSGEAVYSRYGIPSPNQVVEQVDTLLAAN